MKCALSFACAEILFNSTYEFCVSNEEGSGGAQADLKLPVTEEDLGLAILLPLSLGAGRRGVLTMLSCLFLRRSYNAVLAGVDLAK